MDPAWWPMEQISAGIFAATPMAEDNPILTLRIVASVVLGLAGLYYVWSGRQEQSLKPMLWGGLLIMLAALIF